MVERLLGNNTTLLCWLATFQKLFQTNELSQRMDDQGSLFIGCPPTALVKIPPAFPLACFANPRIVPRFCPSRLESGSLEILDAHAKGTWCFRAKQPNFPNRHLDSGTAEHSTWPRQPQTNSGQSDIAVSQKAYK